MELNKKIQQSRNFIPNKTDGFNIPKMFDKTSIFMGLSGFNALSDKLELITNQVHLLPSRRDGWFTVSIKTLAILWKVVKGFTQSQIYITDYGDLEEIDFELSDRIIFDLLEEVVDPDEVFKPPINLSSWISAFRYPINDGYLYRIMDQNCEFTRRIFISKNITKNDVLEFIWSGLGKVIQLNSEDDLSYVKTKLTQKNIFGSTNKLINKINDDYQYFKNKGLSRSYLLIGNPGTGKTGIVNSVVNSINGKVFIISSILASRVNEMECLFVQMKPDFIIFDDCDRSGDGSHFIRNILKLLEEVKDNNPNTNFLFTANSFSGILKDNAVTRKGRIDQIYEIPNPNIDDRKEIFQKYSDEMNFSLPEEDLEKCISLSEGLTGADIKEICIQLQRFSIEEVFAHNQELESLRKKYKSSYTGENNFKIY